MPSQAECHNTSEVTTGITGGIKPKAMSLSVHIKSMHLHEWLLTKRVRLFLSATDPGSASRTCESSQFDTAGHVVIKEDSSSFVVALDDGVQSLRTDAVAWYSGEENFTYLFLISICGMVVVVRWTSVSCQCGSKEQLHMTVQP